MNAYHDSLKHDYEVTGAELDTLVETARQQDGVIGARMTGAGFGGCAIALVEKEKVDHFKQNVNRTYRDKIGYEDRKSTRLNSSHVAISYAVFCLKKKKKKQKKKRRKTKRKKQKHKTTTKPR